MISDSPTPAMLTHILHQAGWLNQGTVTAVEERKSAAFNSQLSFLRLSYSVDAPPTLPTRAVLKRNIGADWAKEAGAEEVKFYKLLATRPDHPPIVPACYAAIYDLANLLATFWTPAQRHQEAREQTLLHRYYQTLCAHGVMDYPREALLTDYRSGLIYWLLVPVQDRYGGAGKAYWWPKMQCLVAAFQDWQCEALLAATARL